MEKTSQNWPMRCLLEKHIKKVGRWESESWEWQGVDLMPKTQDTVSHISDHPRLADPFIDNLTLYKDERSDYRFNLSSQCPKLFLALEFLNTDSEPKIAHLTASQSVVACYMDTDYVVLSIDMPLAVQAWIEAFIGRHGELFEVRKKKWSGAGRSIYGN